MQKFLKINLPIIFLLISVAFVSSVPTSVLVNTKDVKVNAKVKRSSNTNSSSSSTVSTSHKSNLDAHSPRGAAAVASDARTKSELLLGANQGMAAGFIEPKSTPQKRGVNSQLLYNDIFNSAPASGGSSVAVPNGVWSDEIDPSIMYQDLQDFEDYPRGTYKAKPYDNLQSILNAEMYSEPVALPLQYPYSRYYADRKKRSNKKNSYDMRLKRESKLTPADMLALVALVEAGERSRQESENEEASNDYSRSYLSPYASQIDDNNEYNGNSWVDPAIDYYGMPYNLDSAPRYDVMKDQRLASNYYPSKRYMVAKKKRSLNRFLNEPVIFPSISFDNRFTSSDLYKGPKKYQKYF